MTTVKANETKMINSRAARGIAWLGRAALFSLGILTMVVLVAVATLLAVVMLVATAVPAIPVSRDGR